MMRATAFANCAALLLLLALCGCAGYQLGPVNGEVAGGKSVQIVPFTNGTLEPRLADSLTGAVRKQFQHDATFKLASTRDADLLVSGNITHYFRRTQSLSPNDLATARDYRLEMTVHVTVRERVSGKMILDQTVIGTTLIRSGSDLASTERQALPLLSADVAKRIVALLAEGSW